MNTIRVILFGLKINMTGYGEVKNALTAPLRTEREKRMDKKCEHDFPYFWTGMVPNSINPHQSFSKAHYKYCPFCREEKPVVQSLERGVCSPKDTERELNLVSALEEISKMFDGKSPEAKIALSALERYRGNK